VKDLSNVEGIYCRFIGPYWTQTGTYWTEKGGWNTADVSICLYVAHGFDMSQLKQHSEVQINAWEVEKPILKKLATTNEKNESSLKKNVEHCANPNSQEHFGTIIQQR